jgi:hypothetical protein
MPSHLLAAGEYAKAADFITKFAQHRLLIFNSRFRIWNLQLTENNLTRLKIWKFKSPQQEYYSQICSVFYSVSDNSQVQISAVKIPIFDSKYIQK